MAAAYQLSSGAHGGVAYSGIIRTADGRWIANQANSTDWTDYLTWAEANQPDVYVAPVDGGAVITLQPDEVAVGVMIDSLPGAVGPDRPPMALAPPEIVTVPMASGTATAGSTLNCTMGTWNHEPFGYSFQWLSNGAVQVGIGPDYVVQNADAGNTITCIVTAENSMGFTRAPPSNAIGVAAVGVVAAAAVQSTRVERPSDRVEPPVPRHRASTKEE